jgi:signal transduction histidine kinase
MKRQQAVLTLKQIALSNVAPTVKSVLQASSFLHREIPLRLANRQIDMQLLPKEILDIAAVHRLAKHLNTYGEKIRNTSPDDAQKFTQLLLDTKAELDQNVDDAMQSLHQKIAIDGAYADPILYTVLDRVNLTMIALRVLITQHSYASNHSIESKDVACETVVNKACKLFDLVSCVAEDTSAFSIDKNGDAPQIVISGDATVTCIESHIHFILREVLKNSMRAVLDSKKETPIQVQISSQGKDVGIRISDQGGGISTDKREHIFEYFYSTAARFQPTYTYSGNFGAAFDGLGVGLPMARLYAKYVKGSVNVESLPGYGTDTYIYFNKYGETSE